MPLSKHFYYVKPARGFKLWPEMGMYDTMALILYVYTKTACASGRFLNDCF